LNLKPTILESIIFSDALANDLEDLLNGQQYSKIGVITDSNTLKYCYPLIKAHLPADHSLYSFQAGEANKTIHTCMQIWQWMTEEGFDRKALILNVGGGVVGDMGGFCAATYKRGIRFINLPTTLLSQVDASVGGKLGVDFNGFKNHIGVFTSPDTVFIASDFLDTLPEAELRSGYAEVIKHGLIQDADYFSKLKATEWQKQDWKFIIAHSVSIKKDVVTQDPLESGLRKILNFGHTIGHAFETFYLGSEKHLLHGEAIAIGMICEGYLSVKKSGLSKQELAQLSRLLFTIYGKFEFEPDAVSAIVQLCAQDKKNDGQVLNFSLLKSIGTCTYNIPVLPEEIREAILYYRKLDAVSDLQENQTTY
jgi:3-dehydroquinate synthase